MEDGIKRERLARDVEFLASVECAGRAPGTPGGRLARKYVEDRFVDLALQPAGVDGFTQPIPWHGGANLIGSIPGSGPLADRYVVLAAHYDHLGVYDGEIYPGAEDNASGVAIMLEVARHLAQDPSMLGRSVLVCAFDAEEPPYFLTPAMGSVFFVSEPTVPVDKIDHMICLDIVGRRLGGNEVPDAIGNSIFALGGERSSAGDLIDAIEQPGVHLRRADADLVPPLSDHFAFEQAGIPFLLLTCGRSPAYHTPDDTTEFMDYSKMEAFATGLAKLASLISQAAGIGVYRATARDDRATIGSLSAILEALAALDPDAEVALDRLDHMRTNLDHDRLPDRHHRTLASMLISLEEHLAGS